MRAVYSANQRPHVGSSAWAGNENEVPRQPFALETVGTEEIRRPLDNRLNRQDRDMQTRQQADCAGVLMIDSHADRSGARNSSECICHSDIAGCQLLLRALCHNAGKATQLREKLIG